MIPIKYYYIELKLHPNISGLKQIAILLFVFSLCWTFAKKNIF